MNKFVTGTIIAGVLGCLISLGAVGLFFYFFVFNHQTVEMTRAFLRNNQHLAREIGAVKQINAFPEELGYDTASIEFTATGERKTVKGCVLFLYRDEWKASSAYFYDDNLRPVDILK